MLGVKLDTDSLDRKQPDRFDLQICTQCSLEKAHSQGANEPSTKSKKNNNKKQKYHIIYIHTQKEAAEMLHFVYILARGSKAMLAINVKLWGNYLKTMHSSTIPSRRTRRKDMSRRDIVSQVVHTQI